MGGPGRGAGGVCGCRSRCAELRLELIPSGGETREREEPAGHHRTGQRVGEGRREPPPPIETTHWDRTGTLLLPGLSAPAGGEVIENHLCAPERAERGPAPAGRGRCVESRYIIPHLRKGGDGTGVVSPGGGKSPQCPSVQAYVALLRVHGRTNAPPWPRALYT